MKTRLEHDFLGDKEVPIDAYYGVQTLRAVENFYNMSGIQVKDHPYYVVALAQVKWAAVKANLSLKQIDVRIGTAIAKACEEIIGGDFHDQFVVDMIQGGAGTSTNMNANEVIANRALELMGYAKGNYEHCHPNNHVNLSQSTNDAYPTSVKVALLMQNEDLIKDLTELIGSFRDKGKEFERVLKMGRTQLQDAVPMTLGMEFEAFAVTLGEEILRLRQTVILFHEINMGATAIGTGINSDPNYPEKCVKYLRQITKDNKFITATNLIEATPDTGAFVMYSSTLKRLAVKLSKICNDLRLLSSGPRCGLNEINLPKMQPGSSIMPGKVNPVIPEVVNQLCYAVIGNDLTVTMGSEAGQLQLNVMEPIIAYSIFESMRMLTRAMEVLTNSCVKGITANEEYCRQMVLNSVGIVTALNPKLGYETSSKIARQALAENRSISDIVLEQKLLSKAELDNLLRPENMLTPQNLAEIKKGK